MEEKKLYTYIYTPTSIYTWWYNHQVVSDSCNPMDCNLPDSSLHGISQSRILEWVAISFSRGSFPLRDWTAVSNPPERAMAPHSSTLAWKIPLMEKSGGLQSMGSLRVGHNWATSLSQMISAWSITWSVHDQPHDRCMISHVIIPWRATWAVHDQSRDQCMISHVISAWSVKW